jgi:hypothetical protein
LPCSTNQKTPEALYSSLVMKRLAPERLSEIQAVFEQSTNSMYISQQVHLFDVQQAHCCKHVLPSNAALCVDSAKHNL